MRQSANVPKTNAGRQSYTKVLGWLTWVDVVILLVFAIVPCFLTIFIGKISGLWLLLVIAIFIGWGVLLTTPIGGSKIYYILWDSIFRWGFSTKKHYNKKECEKFNVFSKPNPSDEPNVRFYQINNKKVSNNGVCLFYEITPNDISLANSDEIDNFLNKFNSLFTLTDDVNLSLVKLDWNYDFKNNLDWLNNNRQIWKDKPYNKSDKDLIQLNLFEKANEMANLQQTRYINQKRYFLIVNAETLETAQRCFGIVQNELLNAGLQVNPATKEATDLCINKLIPSNGAERIDFYPKYYVVTGKDGKKTYYRTFIIHQLPKIVDAFWNQDIFNMDGLTINMSLRPLEKTESRFNQNPKTRYIQKLNTLAKDRKTRSLVEEKEQEHELMSIQELAEDVANGDEKIKIAKYLVTFSADSKLNLKIVERKVKTAITKNKMRFNFCDCKQWDAYKANVPAFESVLEKECNMMLASTHLTLSYPFVYSDYLDEKGDLYGYKVNGANPLLIDFTKVDGKVNMWNTFCFGKPGGGKTTAVKKILRNFIVNPRFRKIFLIDPENEYTNAIKNFDGDVLDCSGLTKDSGHINPFQIFVSGSQNEKDESSDNFNNWQQHFFFLENFFQSLVNSDNSHREWDSATIGVLSKIVIQVYKDKKIYPTSDFKKVSANKWPIFDDLIKCVGKELQKARKSPKKANYDLDTLEKIYYPLTQFGSGGAYESIWNAPTNIKLDNRIVCFNIQRLNKSSVPTRIKMTQMWLLLRFIEDLCIENKEYNDKLGILGDDTKCYHTAVFCDEFHLLIDKEFPNVIKWFYGFTKRIRKYKGRVVLITQNIKDMVSDDSSFQSQTTGIINSCQFLFIFKLLANDIANLDRLLQKIGGLKNEEINFLKTGEHGQAIFISGNDIHIKMKFAWNDNLEKRCMTDRLGG